MAEPSLDPPDDEPEHEPSELIDDSPDDTDDDGAFADGYGNVGAPLAYFSSLKTRNL